MSAAPPELDAIVAKTLSKLFRLPRGCFPAWVLANLKALAKTFEDNLKIIEVAFKECDRKLKDLQQATCLRPVRRQKRRRLAVAQTHSVVAEALGAGGTVETVEA